MRHTFGKPVRSSGMAGPDHPGPGTAGSPGPHVQSNDPPGEFTMLHHQGHEKQMTEAERERLLIEGATAQGMVNHSETLAADPRMTQVHVIVRFKDGQTVEFGEELANLYQAAPGSPEARRLAEVRGAEQ